MNNRPIFITESDRVRLQGLIDSQIGANADKRYVAALEGELRRARFVEPGEVPTDVVTMNSTVRVRDLESDDTDTYTVVYPPQADAENGRISVLAPIGTAIIGTRVGDLVQWPVPAGTRRFKVEDVLVQPERDGVDDPCRDTPSTREARP